MKFVVTEAGMGEKWKIGLTPWLLDVDNFCKFYILISIYLSLNYAFQYLTLVDWFIGNALILVIFQVNA
jgi:hypothetical protein